VEESRLPVGRAASGNLGIEYVLIYQLAICLSTVAMIEIEEIFSSSSVEYW
jgi:hypothetical protein